MMDSFYFKNKVIARLRKTISCTLLVTFGLTMGIAPSRAQILPNLPAPGQMLWLTSGFQPPLLKGMTVHPENPLLFDFIVDRGQEKISNDLLKDESTKLIKYFLAAMTIPDKDAWVNLSPYENNRIIPEALGQTEMGRQMLEQDYILKQLSASLTNPEKELGQKFWNEVKSRAQKQFGTTDIPLSTFNKVWIVPAGATVVERDGFAYITESKLKVMLDEDYLALAKNATPQTQGFNDQITKLSSEVFREQILPQLNKELNEGKNFAPTRQVYQSVILADWYKRALKDSLLGRIYADKSKVQGVESDVENVKQKVYDQYLEAFKKGVYNVIKEDSADSEAVPRKYFSGGLQLGMNLNPDDLKIVRGSSSVNQAVTEINNAGDQIALVASSAAENPEEAQAKEALASGLMHEDNISRDIQDLDDVYGMSELLDERKDQERVQVLMIGVGKGLAVMQMALRYPNLEIVAVNKTAGLWDEEFLNKSWEPRLFYSEAQRRNALERIHVVTFDIEDEARRQEALRGFGDSHGKFDMVFWETNVTLYLQDHVRAIEALFNERVKENGIYGFEIPDVKTPVPQLELLSTEMGKAFSKVGKVTKRAFTSDGTKIPLEIAVAPLLFTVNRLGPGAVAVPLARKGLIEHPAGKLSKFIQPIFELEYAQVSASSSLADRLAALPLDLQVYGRLSLRGIDSIKQYGLAGSIFSNPELLESGVVIKVPSEQIVNAEGGHYLFQKNEASVIAYLNASGVRGVPQLLEYGNISWGSTFKLDVDDYVEMRVPVSENSELRVIKLAVPEFFTERGSWKQLPRIQSRVFSLDAVGKAWWGIKQFLRKTVTPVPYMKLQGLPNNPQSIKDSVYFRKMNFRERVDAVADLAGILDRIHAAGVIHNSISEDHVLVSQGPDGKAQYMVIDFSDSLLVGEEQDFDEWLPRWVGNTVDSINGRYIFRFRIGRTIAGDMKDFGEMMLRVLAETKNFGDTAEEVARNISTYIDLVTVFLDMINPDEQSPRTMAEFKAKFDEIKNKVPEKSVESKVASWKAFQEMVRLNSETSSMRSSVRNNDVPDDQLPGFIARVKKVDRFLGQLTEEFLISTSNPDPLARRLTMSDLNYDIVRQVFADLGFNVGFDQDHDLTITKIAQEGAPAASSAILIVEDHDATREGIVETLMDEGYNNILTAISAEDAVKLLEGMAPDQRATIRLVVSDFHMGARNGHQFLIEDAPRLLPNVPRILFTADPQDVPSSSWADIPVISKHGQEGGGVFVLLKQVMKYLPVSASSGVADGDFIGNELGGVVDRILKKLNVAAAGDVLAAVKEGADYIALDAWWRGESGWAKETTAADGSKVFVISQPVLNKLLVKHFQRYPESVEVFNTMGVRDIQGQITLSPEFVKIVNDEVLYSASRFPGGESSSSGVINKDGDVVPTRIPFREMQTIDTFDQTIGERFFSVNFGRIKGRELTIFWAWDSDAQKIHTYILQGDYRTRLTEGLNLFEPKVSGHVQSRFSGFDPLTEKEYTFHAFYPEQQGQPLWTWVQAGDTVNNGEAVIVAAHDAVMLSSASSGVGESGSSRRKLAERMSSSEFAAAWSEYLQDYIKREEKDFPDLVAHPEEYEQLWDKVPDIMKRALLNDRTLRLVFTQGLDERSLGNLNIVDKELNGLQIGGIKVIDFIRSHASFSVGGPTAALRALKNNPAVRIIAGVTDRPGGRSQHVFSGVANGRAVYFPFEDGTWLLIKGAGQWINPRMPTFFPRYSPQEPDTIEDHLGLLSQYEAERSARFHDKLQGNKGFLFAQTLAWQTLNEYPDGEGGLKPFEKLILKYELAMPALAYKRVMYPQRLSQVEFVVENDQDVELMRQIASRTLANVGLIAKGEVLTAKELTELWLRRFAAAEAFKQNNQLYKRTIHDQDWVWPIFQEMDDEEFLDLAEYTKTSVFGAPVGENAKMFNQYGISIRGISEMLFKFGDMDRDRESSHLQGILPSSMRDIANISFSHYFRLLDQKFLILWATNDVLNMESQMVSQGRFVRTLETIHYDVQRLARTAMSSSAASSGVGETGDVGGINFDPTLLNLQIKRDGRGVPLPLPQQNLENIDIKGLYPVIINIRPVNAQTLPILGQLQAPAGTALSKG